MNIRLVFSSPISRFYFQEFVNFFLCWVEIVALILIQFVRIWLFFTQIGFKFQTQFLLFYVNLKVVSFFSHFLNQFVCWYYFQFWVLLNVWKITFMKILGYIGQSLCCGSELIWFNRGPTCSPSPTHHQELGFSPFQQFITCSCS